LGFGLRDFSMHPANLLLVKQRVLMTSVSQITEHVAAIMRSGDPDEIRERLEQLNAL
jgi:phosphotransferase system enzyme I (PtsI)